MQTCDAACVGVTCLLFLKMLDQVVSRMGLWVFDLAERQALQMVGFSHRHQLNMKAAAKRPQSGKDGEVLRACGSLIGPGTAAAAVFNAERSLAQMAQMLMSGK